MTGDSVWRRWWWWGFAALAALQIFSLFLHQLLAVALIIVAAAIWISERNLLPIRLRGVLLAYLVFVFTRMLSGLKLAFPDSNIRDIQFPLLSAVFFAVSYSVALSCEVPAQRVERIWLVAAAATGLWAVMAVATGIETRAGLPFGPHLHHPDGTVEGNYSTLAKFSVFTLSCFGPALLSRMRGRSWLLATGVWGLVWGALILTFSRSGMLAAVVVHGYWLFKMRRRWLLGLAALGSAVIIATPQGRMRVMQSVDPSQWSTGRAQLWRAAVPHLAERPWFGHGLGSFDAILDPETIAALPDPGVGDWHNQYLQIYMESGIVGFAAFIGFLVVTGRALMKGLREAADSDQKDRLGGGLALIMAFMILSLFEQTLSSPAGNVYFWTLLGMTVGRLDHMERGAVA